MVESTQDRTRKYYARLLCCKPWPTIYGKCLSSRHFDAVGTKTCQIDVSWAFQRYFESDRHYLALIPISATLNRRVGKFADEGGADRSYPGCA